MIKTTSKLIQSNCKCGRKYAQTVIEKFDDYGNLISYRPLPSFCIACNGNPKEQILPRNVLGSMRAYITMYSHLKLTIVTKV